MRISNRLLRILCALAPSMVGVQVWAQAVESPSVAVEKQVLAPAPTTMPLTTAEVSVVKGCLPEAYRAFTSGLTEGPGGMWAFPDLWKAPDASLSECGIAHGLTAGRTTVPGVCNHDAVLGATAKAMRDAGVTRSQIAIKILSLPLGYRAVVDRVYESASSPDEVLAAEWNRCYRPFASSR